MTQHQERLYLLVRDFYRFRHWQGITIGEAMRIKPLYAAVTDGFGEYFGPGKSPFNVLKMLVMDDTLHVLVDRDAFRHPKWQTKLYGWFGVHQVVFYDGFKQEQWEEWRVICRMFESLMAKPIWQRSAD